MVFLPFEVISQLYIFHSELDLKRNYFLYKKYSKSTGRRARRVRQYQTWSVRTIRLEQKTKKRRWDGVIERHLVLEERMTYWVGKTLYFQRRCVLTKKKEVQ